MKKFSRLLKKNSLTRNEAAVMAFTASTNSPNAELPARFSRLLQ